MKNNLTNIIKNIKNKNLTFPEFVNIFEVGPRDGLQNEKTILSKEFKFNLINDLSRTGLTNIEFGSFVSPKWVPQMADTKEIYQEIKDKILVNNTNIKYSALVPNMYGLKSAIDCGLTDIAVFTAVSETFTKKNTNCTIEDSLNKIKNIVTEFKNNNLNKNITIRGYISCIFGCPYEGKIELSKVYDLSKQLFEIGCDIVSLGDTIGIGNANDVIDLLNYYSTEEKNKLALHFHDNNSTAIENTLIGLSQGISNVDSSVGGLGGCPYAKTPKGNLSTEKIIWVLNNLNIKTGVDFNKIKEIGEKINKDLNKEYDCYDLTY